MIINIAGGRGVMGKVHKPVLEAAGHKVIISGRTSIPSLEEAAQQTDLTIVSVPINVTEEVIKKIAPFCNAITDFTTLKTFPVAAMLKYSKENCEVAGFHPLYGDVASIKGRTIVYCPTQKSGEKCQQLIKSFELAGAKIEIMSPRTHDLEVNGLLQDARSILFESFALLLNNYGVSPTEAYEISPPPTKILLELIARQAAEENDALFREMRDYNPFKEEIYFRLTEALKTVIKGKNIPQKIRELYGKDLKLFQEKARNLINSHER